MPRGSTREDNRRSRKSNRRSEDDKRARANADFRLDALRSHMLSYIILHTSMTRRLRRITLTFIFTAALLPASIAAAPTDTLATDGPEDVVERSTLLRLLNSDSAEKQARAVHLIGTYAHNEQFDTDYFRVLVTPLHGVVATGKTEAIRIMAISALSAIGTESAMEGLKTQVDDLTPRRVQRLTQFALVQYEAERPTAMSRRPER